MNHEQARTLVNQYCRLRDVQFAAYELYARKFGLTAKELFVLDILWFAPDGCLQSDICWRLSATRQTISAIVKKFWKQGYVSFAESEKDRRNKIVRLTEAGRWYAKEIIPPAAKAEIAAMNELSKKDATALVQLTTVFSAHMQEKFEEIRLPDKETTGKGANEENGADRY